MSVVLGGWIAFCAYVALGRMDLGPSPQLERASAASLAARSARLDAMEAGLHKALARKPPKLPRIPRYPPVTIPQPPRVAAPRVVQVAYATVAPSHAQGGASREHEHEDEHEDEGDD